jgi:SP family galactose:H+ symporter-like MFS transporter
MEQEAGLPKDVKRYVIIVCCIAALGGLLFGLDQGFINGSLQYLENDMQLSMTQGEKYAAVMPLGCIVGAVISGWVARVMGRKRTLVLAAFFFTAFSILGATTQSITVLFASRFCIGLAVGCASFIVPLYLSEVAPYKMRGALVSLYQLMITLGIVLIYISNSVIGAWFHSWRLMLGIIAVPAVVMFIGTLRIPRTPRWLLLKGHHDEAKDVLRKTRGTEEAVKFEYDEIEKSLAQQKESGFIILKNRNFLKLLALGISLQVLQQFCGINAIIYYSGQIFSKAGVGNPAVATVAVGLVNMFTVFIAIKYVDRFGRKPLFYIGLTTLTITLIICGSIFRIQDVGNTVSDGLRIVLLIACLVYIFGFEISLGPLVWVLCSELFPLKGRDLGMTITTAVNWIGVMIVTRFSLTIMHTYGGSTLFFIFAACCAAGFVLIGFFTPETKGVTLEEIQFKLNRGEKLRNIGYAKS